MQSYGIHVRFSNVKVASLYGQIARAEKSKRHIRARNEPFPWPKRKLHKPHRKRKKKAVLGYVPIHL